MLIQYPPFKEPERYSSYKARMKNRYFEKVRKLNNAIDQTSLKPEDKEKFKKEMAAIFK